MCEDSGGGHIEQQQQGQIFFRCGREGRQELDQSDEFSCVLHGVEEFLDFETRVIQTDAVWPRLMPVCRHVRSR